MVSITRGRWTGACYHCDCRPARDMWLPFSSKLKSAGTLMSPFTCQSVHTVIGWSLPGGPKNPHYLRIAHHVSFWWWGRAMVFKMSSFEAAGPPACTVFIHWQCHLCTSAECSKAASDVHHISGFLLLTPCLSVWLPQVRCVWTDPAPVRQRLDPPGHRQALSLGRWVSALINQSWRREPSAGG